jgi:hypothetical protein
VERVRPLEAKPRIAGAPEADWPKPAFSGRSFETRRAFQGLRPKRSGIVRSET